METPGLPIFVTLNLRRSARGTGERRAALVTLAVMETGQGKLYSNGGARRTRDFGLARGRLTVGNRQSRNCGWGAQFAAQAESRFHVQPLPRRGIYGGIYQRAGRK